MPVLSECKVCAESFDECGGSMSRGRHYAPYCSRYCQMFQIKGYKIGEGQYPKFDMDCDWCGGPFQLRKAEPKVVKGSVPSNVVGRPEENATTRLTGSCKH